MKVLSTSPTFGQYSREPVDLLRKCGFSLAIAPAQEAEHEERLGRLVEDADALIVGVEKITRTVLARAKKLKVIAKHGAGVDNIDLTAATERGIVVANAPGANAEAVAELTFALFLALARQVLQADHNLRRGVWQKFVGVELTGKILGVIGTGQAGRRVIRRAAAFEMRVLGFDTAPLVQPSERELLTYVSFETLLAESDFISVHVPLNPDTAGLFGEKELAVMKPTAYLVNISRGGVVREAALYRALKEKKIAGAALDVFNREPVPATNPLLSLDNFIATPHMGGYTREAMYRVGIITARNVINVLNGERPLYLVNPEVY